MTKIKHDIFMSLDAEDGAEVLTRVQMFPQGPVIRGRDGRGWKLHNPDKLVEASEEDGTPARPFLGVSRNDEREIMDVVEDYLAGVMQ